MITCPSLHFAGQYRREVVFDDFCGTSASSQGYFPAIASGRHADFPRIRDRWPFFFVAILVSGLVGSQADHSNLVF